MTKRSPLLYFKTSPEIIRVAVMMYVRFPLFLRNVEDLLHESGIDLSYETVRFWWHRFGPMFASETQSMFGAGALNCRFTFSRGHGTELSETVVFMAFPRTIPRNPMPAIRRATVQRAAASPSRHNCR